MIKKYFKIENIPAILWGESSENIFIAVHGNLSNKEDDIIQIFAKKAVSLGYQVISFDLPEHGERVEEDIKCKVWDCVRELNLIMNYVKQNWNNISLLAYKDDFIKQSLFISPVLNMKRIIDNMMLWFDIDEEYLKSKQIVKTPIGQNLYWDYYCYVKDNPIDKWNIPTNILYGLKDDLCESDIVFKFVKRFNCNITVMNKGEHYFHTQEQLKFFKQWVDESIHRII